MEPDRLTVLVPHRLLALVRLAASVPSCSLARRSMVAHPGARGEGQRPLSLPRAPEPGSPPGRTGFRASTGDQLRAHLAPLLSLSLSESVRIAADRVSTHKAAFLSQRIIVLKRKPLAVTLTDRSRLPILNIPFVPILCMCLCMACR